MLVNKLTLRETSRKKILAIKIENIITKTLNSFIKTKQTHHNSLPCFESLLKNLHLILNNLSYFESLLKILRIDNSTLLEEYIKKIARKNFKNVEKY